MSYKTYFNWSTGKDSALALYKTLQNPLNPPKPNKIFQNPFKTAQIH